jgi:acyl homoserine lactone synthase
VILAIEQYNASKYSNLLDEMFRLRARVFRDRLKWDVHVAGGKERDRYDDMGPVYLVHTDESARQVKGCLRLLPTTGPTVLTEFFSDTLPPAARISHPTIWECTRFCLDDAITERGHRDELVYASAVLIAALGDLALNSGVESILGNFDSTMLRLYRHLGCEVEVLGSTNRYGRPVYLGLFVVSQRVLRNVKGKLRNSITINSAEMRVLAA